MRNALIQNLNEFLHFGLQKSIYLIALVAQFAGIKYSQISHRQAKQRKARHSMQNVN